MPKLISNKITWIELHCTVEIELLGSAHEEIYQNSMNNIPKLMTALDKSQILHFVFPVVTSRSISTSQLQ